MSLSVRVPLRVCEGQWGTVVSEECWVRLCEGPREGLGGAGRISLNGTEGMCVSVRVCKIWSDRL